jgi:hypothetical protein
LTKTGNRGYQLDRYGQTFDLVKPRTLLWKGEDGRWFGAEIEMCTREVLEAAAGGVLLFTLMVSSLARHVVGSTTEWSKRMQRSLHGLVQYVLTWSTV